MELLLWIENSAFSTWMRESESLFAYPGILFLHTAGLSIVVGISVVVDLRLLGWLGDLPLGPLDRFFPILWTGFWINAVSGAALLAQNASTRFTSPVFGIKMALIACALVDTMLIRRLIVQAAPDRHRLPGRSKLLAAASLILWFGAITAGRLMVLIFNG